MNGIQEVSGSIPLISTIGKPWYPTDTEVFFYRVQGIENFATGSNQNVAYADLLVETVRELESDGTLSQLNSYEEKVDAVEAAILDKYGKPGDNPVESMRSIVTEVYENYVGEKEAFNTEDSLDLSRKERKETAPYMADSGRIADSQSAEAEFESAHKRLGWNSVDRKKAPIYNQVRKGWYGVQDQGISRLVSEEETADNTSHNRIGRGVGDGAPSEVEIPGVGFEKTQISEKASVGSDAFSIAPDTRYSLSVSDRHAQSEYARTFYSNMEFAPIGNYNFRKSRVLNM